LQAKRRGLKKRGSVGNAHTKLLMITMPSSTTVLLYCCGQLDRHLLEDEKGKKKEDEEGSR
jgi:hypothetical protein